MDEAVKLIEQIVYMHILEYSGVAEPCLGKAYVKFQKGNRSSLEIVYFSNKTTSNFLSRDACMAFGIIPSGFPHAEVNMAVGDKVNKFESSTKHQDKDDVRVSKLVGDFEDVFKEQKLQPMDT